MIAAVPESVAWYQQLGVFYLDWDSPREPIPSAAHAIWDSVRAIPLFTMLFALPFPFLGAGLGSGFARLRRSPEAAAA